MSRKRFIIRNLCILPVLNVLDSPRCRWMTMSVMFVSRIYYQCIYYESEGICPCSMCRFNVCDSDAFVYRRRCLRFMNRQMPRTFTSSPVSAYRIISRPACDSTEKFLIPTLASFGSLLVSPRNGRTYFRFCVSRSRSSSNMYRPWSLPCSRRLMALWMMIRLFLCTILEYVRTPSDYSLGQDISRRLVVIFMML